jgi:hypothetical protein
VQPRGAFARVTAYMPARPRSREIEGLVQAFTEQLEEAVEAAISGRAQFLSDEFLRAAATPRRRSASTVLAVPVLPSLTEAHKPGVAERSPEVQPARPRATAVRPKRRRPALVSETKAPLPIDPEDERRATEFARLRAILRPTAPIPPAPPLVAPTLRATAEDDSLRALEDQIRDQIPALPGLSQSRYTARIASWVGRVRLHQSGPDGERTRIASRILFDKLRNLAWSMEAGPIEGLNISWSTRNWERYIEDHELIAATPEATPPAKPEPDADEDVWSTPNETGMQA